MFAVAGRARRAPAGDAGAGPRRVAATLITAMVAKLAGGALAALLLAATAAQASDATTVADRAGFLIGHAQRCGVAQARLERSTKRLNAVIAAFADDADDREAARTQFGDSLIAAAFAKALGDPLPSCTTVLSMLTQFERHRQPEKASEGQQMARAHRDGDLARHAASTRATPGSVAKRTSTKREELSAGRRASLETRRTAQQSRSRPPSI
jgi:hypothetical protein